jgi:hypothetical protein
LDGKVIYHAWKKPEICIKFWFEKVHGKQPLGKPRRGKKDNIKSDLRKAHCYDFVTTVMKLDVS